MKKLLSRCTLLLALLVVPAACAPSAGGTSATGTSSAPRRLATLISPEEVRDANVSNAYELVQRLRPSWLRSRGVDSINRSSTVIVYYDGVQMGGPDSLRRIALNDVGRVEYFDAGTATMKWGTGHSRGAISVHSR